MCKFEIIVQNIDILEFGFSSYIVPKFVNIVFRIIIL